MYKYEMDPMKIQSGHDSVHRRSDGQGDTSIPPFKLRWSGGGGIMIIKHHFIHLKKERENNIDCDITVLLHISFLFIHLFIYWPSETYATYVTLYYNK